MQLTAQEAYWFLPFVTPIALYVAISDLKDMRIPNASGIALVGVFLLVGLWVLPFDTYLWRIAQMAVALAVGFGMNMARLIGGGDAKIAAAMAPFVAFQDWRLVLIIYGGMLLAAYVTHRLFRAMPWVRRLTPTWKSWETGKKFPMGLALSGTFLGYLALGVL